MFRRLMVKIDNIIHVQIRQCSVSVNISKNTTDPVVQISDGKLRGAVSKLLDGGNYYSFKGIRYGQAPVGTLRFKSPLPVEPWDGVKDALEHGPKCPQIDLVTGEVEEGSEDCLYLNVYSKSLSPDVKKPVIFFIHGGGYMAGSGDSTLYGPDYLLQHDVVLVTINYRLEAFGFLCLDTPTVPGNAGMRDQILALKWVQKNIAHFGGNPQNVTIFGESAGGASVTYHLISPLSKGLFNKAIVHSGVCLNYWSEMQDGKEVSIKAAKALGKETTNPSEILTFLQSVPAVDLIRLTLKIMTADERKKGIPILFAPVVEKKFNDTEPFIQENPVDILQENIISPVPTMIGYTTGEGLSNLGFFLKQLEFFNKNLHYRIPRAIRKKVPENVVKEFGERLRKFYFNDKEITKNDAQKIIEMETDYAFSYEMHRFVNLLKTQAPLYMFRIDCDTELNVLKNLIGFKKMKGMCHADDLFYIFSSIMTSDTYENNEDVRKLVFNITKMWTDFAKQGNPTPDNSVGVNWPQFTQKSKDFMNITNDLRIQQNADNDRVEFWNKLYSEAGLPIVKKS